MRIWDLTWRYGLAIILGAFHTLFYTIFSPWTLKLSYWLINLFYEVTLNYSTILVNDIEFTLIPACTAATAYLLLSLLILVTRAIKPLIRFKMFVYGALTILAFNVLRILALVFVYVEFGRNFFDALHLIFWNFISIAVVLLVWAFLTKKYKVKKIPVYSDFEYLIKKLK